MEKPFVYGMSVEGKNFTDRVKETARLKKDFQHGINVILISPRRIGKTSLVKKVRSEITDPLIMVVIMDIYDCRSEYDFYNRFATAILKQTATKSEQVLDYLKKFLVRLTPKFSFSPEANSDFSLSLGITPKEYSPEEILNLPEKIAQDRGIHIVVCIDEFQQIGEFSDSLSVQKRLRGAWQHHQHVSYCLFGSKKHLMTQLFQNRSMPFYQFGEMIELKRIPSEEWVPFIIDRFADNGQTISRELAEQICKKVDNYSSYVQQLAWNVMAEAGDIVNEQDVANGIETLLAQNSSFFVEQIRGLSTYQLNFIKAICMEHHKGLASKKIAEEFPMGTKSNISRIKAALLDREIIDEDHEGVFLPDCVFRLWFMKEYM